MIKPKWWFWPMVAAVLFIVLSLGYAQAGEKEEWDLKKQVVVERMEKLKAQSGLIAMQFELLSRDLKFIEEKLKSFESPAQPQKEEIKKEEKKDASKNKKN